MNAEGSFGKLYVYPDGTHDLIVGTRAVFRPEIDPKSKVLDQKPKVSKPQGKKDPSPDDLERARRRARAAVRRLALANDFRWFVTLTLDPEKINRYDPGVVVKRLSQWCSNQVKRRGLRYILVPEHHKDGAIHFHGFFSDSLPAVDSGHKDKGGHPVFNLPGWGYGYSTAIELYGSYQAAVAYTCKYIGKETDKIGGRWYYSGGDLKKPVEKFVDVRIEDLDRFFRDPVTGESTFDDDPNTWYISTPGGIFAGVKDWRIENGQCNQSDVGARF